MIWLSGKAHISITWALSNNLSLSASKAVEWDYHKSAFFFIRSLWKHRLFHSKLDFNNRDVHCIHISCCSHQWRGLSSKITVSKPVNNCWQNIKLHFEETNVGWHYKRKEWKWEKKRLLFQVTFFHLFCCYARERSVVCSVSLASSCLVSCFGSPVNILDLRFKSQFNMWCSHSLIREK